ATNGLDQDVILTVTQVFGLGPTFDCNAVAAADTNNRCQVLGTLTEAMNMNGTDIGDIYDELQTLGTDDEVRAALDSLSGDMVPQMANILFRQNDQFRDISLNRIGNAMKKDKVAVAPVRLASAGADMQQQLAMLVSNTGALLGEGAEDPLTGGLWAKVVGQHDLAHADNQLNVTHYGFQGGLDGILSDRWMLGATGAFTTADVDMEGRPQDSTTDTWQAGVYTAWNQGQLWLAGMLGYGFHQTDYGRDIQVGAVQRHAEGEYDAHSVTGVVEAAYGFYLDGAWSLTPAVSLRYTGIWQEGFTETGAGGVSLRFDDSYDDNLTGTAALSFTRSYMTDAGNRLIPQFRLGVRYDMGDRDLSRDVDFIGLPGVIMDIGPAAWEDRLSGLVGLGFAYIIPSEALALLIDYDGRVNSDLSSHRIFAGLRIQW
ncbi:MAG: autotransporter outer membrane beta-barrel domain-containing protein, partial [Pseudomonadota bacterium]|nr:autotransporter outer membrane beta-barrel domain-containing protein [Pseudomonadota bacterium]